MIETIWYLMKGNFQSKENVPTQQPLQKVTPSTVVDTPPSRIRFNKSQGFTKRTRNFQPFNNNPHFEPHK